MLLYYFNTGRKLLKRLENFFLVQVNRVDEEKLTFARVESKPEFVFCF